MLFKSYIRKTEVIFQTSCLIFITLSIFVTLQYQCWSVPLSSQSSKEKAIETIQFFFERITMSYFIQANLLSLSRQWALCSFCNRSNSLTLLKLPFLTSKRIMCNLFWISSQYWQVSILAFLKLSKSPKSSLNMFLKVEKLITGPLFFSFERFVFRFGFTLTNSLHILRIDVRQSKYRFWVLDLL